MTEAFLIAIIGLALIVLALAVKCWILVQDIKHIGCILKSQRSATLVLAQTVADDVKILRERLDALERD